MTSKSVFQGQIVKKRTTFEISTQDIMITQVISFPKMYHVAGYLSCTQKPPQRQDYYNSDYYSMLYWTALILVCLIVIN